MLRTAFATLCLAAGLASTALAQDAPTPLAPTDPPAGGGRIAGQLREACAADVQKFCPGLGPGPERRACLREHRAQLTQTCRDAMAAARAAAGVARKRGS